MNSSQGRKKAILKHFVLDGAGASICEGFTESQFFTYASSAAPSGSWLGFMASMQNLISFLLQLWSSTLLHLLKTQKRFVLVCISLQVLILVALTLSVFFSLGFFPFLVLSVLFTVLGSLSAPAWSHWVSELLPPNQRGACFGIRNQVSAPSQLLAVLIAGAILQWGNQKWLAVAHVSSAFVLVFILGLAAKLFSLWHLFKLPEIERALDQTVFSRESPIQFVRVSFQCIDTKKIALILGATGFAIHLSLPFQTAYLIQNLHLGYDEIGVITATYLGVRFLVSKRMGALLDTSGSRSTLILSSALLPLAPLGWIVSHGFLGIWFTQVIASLIWSVFELSVFTFISDVMPFERRQRAFTVRYMSWNLASVGGALIGGLIVSQVRLPQVVFFLSFCARVVAALLVMEALGMVQVFGYFSSHKGRSVVIESESVEK